MQPYINFILFNRKSSSVYPVPVYGNRHGGVRSAAVAEACNSRGSKVGWDVLGCYPHLVSEKTGEKINCRSCRRDLYLEINIADLR